MNTKSSNNILVLGAILTIVIVTFFYIKKASSPAPSSNSTQNSGPNLALERDKETGLRYGKVYRMDRWIDKDGWNTPAMKGIIYVFTPKGVTVSIKMNNPGGIAVNNASGEIVRLCEKTWHKGEALSDKDGHSLTVAFGPGDLMPILQDAPYKLEGHSIYVDWSRGQTKYFEFISKYGFNSEPQILAVENEGMVLKTLSGDVFTVDLF